MWENLAKNILRKRAFIILILVLITVFLSYFATKVSLQYEFSKLLPENDPVFIEYEDFKGNFGLDGMVIVIATCDKDFYELEKFKSWYEMGLELKNLKIPVDNNNSNSYSFAIDSIFSEAHLYTIKKDEVDKVFNLTQLVTQVPSSQTDVDHVFNTLKSLPFYHDVIFNPQKDLHLMMLFVNKDVFNSSDRGNLIDDIKEVTKKYEKNLDHFHYSGLPFIRSVTMNKVKSELFLFVILAMIVTAGLLFFFFRSFKVVMISMIVVIIGVVWSFGSIGLIGYEITILMGLIPPLIIVIGIANCVYLINKYQQEYRSHGNKAKSLTRVIRKVGNATFMTNATTAMGFGTFIFTHSDMMKEFGVIASINIMCIFFLSIFLVPIIYSYTAPPSNRHTKHLDKKWLYKLVDKLVLFSTSYRTTVYLITIGCIIAGIIGMSLMHTTGNIADDLPKSDKVVKDLEFFEKELNGVMPFEIVVESKDTIYKSTRNLIRIQALQNVLKEENYLSKSLSIIDALQYIYQANSIDSIYPNGQFDRYKLDFNSYAFQNLVEKSEYFLNTFNEDSVNMSNGFLSSFVDSSQHKTRITFQIADIGTASMDSLISRVSLKIEKTINPEQILLDQAFSSDGLKRDSLLNVLYRDYNHINYYVAHKLSKGDLELIMEFPENIQDIINIYSRNEFENALLSAIENYHLSSSITGSGILFTKGTTYLVKNLFISLMIAVFVIAILMSFLFRSWRMVLVSMFPNLIPLIVTSAIMGYFGIPIKPSTILVFSIAFGISIDDTIHFLAKYRQELKVQNGNIRESVIIAIKETGVSMIYTSIILFFGFSIFIASNFGGTQALGILVSVTLLIAMLANLVLLPSLLLSLEKRIVTKAFRESTYEFIDDEDIELEKLNLLDKKDK